MTSSYEGTRVDGLREGPGIERFEDGTIYVGEFFADKKHGKGVQIFADGSSYEGDFADGVREGKGTYRLEDGIIGYNRHLRDNPGEVSVWRGENFVFDRRRAEQGSDH